jgi:hypothetical protein
MSEIPDHGINDPDVHADEEYVLPCVQALLAATPALMPPVPSHPVPCGTPLPR